VLPKPHRLTKDPDIQRVFDQGRFLSSPLVNLKFLRHSKFKIPDSTSRFAVIVSKKTLKRAVDRNRVKRLVRESLRLLLPDIQPGFDAIFLPQVGIIDHKQPQVQQAVSSLLSKAGMI
jgi:ribonuclease P protein component